MATVRAKKKKKRNNSFLIGLLIAAFLGFMIYSCVSVWLQIKDYNDKISLAQAKLEAQNLENSELQNYLDTASKDEIIVRIARDKLGYVMPDERIFYDAG